MIGATTALFVKLYEDLIVIDFKKSSESTEDDVSTMMAGLIYNCTDGLTFSPHIVQTTKGSLMNFFTIIGFDKRAV